ncbi:MAG TPA: helix-turn-helix transcriptional regulator [Verrucomicrobiae bacterium]|nr:helix-turn-helix transcriptional regulator [Verrucomicrobiae bacterium]
MKNSKKLHEKWMNDPKYRDEYAAVETEFDLARALIAARTKAGLTQEEVAERMTTSQSFVSRLEGGSVTPTWKSLQRYAHATGTKLRIELEHA